MTTRVPWRPAGGGEPVLLETGAYPSDLVWSPDGTELAVILRGTEPSANRMAVYRFDDASLTPDDAAPDDVPNRFALWAAANGGGWSGLSGEAVDARRSMSQDASYQWIIVVDPVGAVAQQAALEDPAITPVPGLPEALAADW